MEAKTAANGYNWIWIQHQLVEGASNEGGRGPSIWDAFSHTAGKIIDGSNGDTAVDQYHKFKEDIELIAKLGFEAYRFSISWSRIFPDGLGTKVNEEGISYYNNVIDALLERGIQPYVTLYHWDLPLYLHETIEGWLNKEIVYLHPIYYGDYPEVMRAKLGERLPKFTEEEKELLRNSLDFVGLNHYTSRFISHVRESPEENDFYKAQEVEIIAEWEGGERIGEKAASEWLYVVPWGIRKVLNYIAKTYNNPPIYVTENGMDDEENETSPLQEMLDDKLRVVYFKRYLAAVAQAIKDGADVKGYFAWSLLDNFEWAQGYTKRFGLIYVDYKNGFARHPKSSAYWFLRFFKGGQGKKGKEE
ncbi:Glycoside hydrolase [Trema orientale]|uniref:Glycoside hydrolase n=1 Tax=Trema orientale TaxID=63057 RepID=A0A2P5B9T4_TREOI|nr:Glycoside hydrolase [Trema orientale]